MIVRCNNPKPHRRVFDSETGQQVPTMGFLRCTCGSILLYEVPRQI